MIYLIAYALFCIAFAYLNSYLIKRNKKILHGINGAIHLLVAGAGWQYFGWQIGVAVLFVARLFFDVSLNLFRGLPIDYIPIKPKSIVDKVEKKVFRTDGISPKILYLFIIVVLTVLYVNK